MTGAQVVERARGAIGHGCVYVLGKGGIKPDALYPWPPGMPNLGCDCSGFVAWALGVSRWIEKWHPSYEGGDWFETTAVLRDAQRPYGFVNAIPWASAQPGDILVWGDANGKQGHIGIVTECDATGPSMVVHCSKGNWRKSGDAIQETDVSIFQHNGAIAARVDWVNGEAA